jgi:hypothetical protein
MRDYSYQVSGWLNASGMYLLDYLQSGCGLYRKVTVSSKAYSTGYVSTGEGSFKLPCQSGNWYATSLQVADAEVRPIGLPICEYSLLNQDVPVWNMSKLPQRFLVPIHADRNLETGQFAKSQFIVECLQKLDLEYPVSGVHFPSRRADGDVIILNPQVVSIRIVFTGQFPATGYA